MVNAGVCLRLDEPLSNILAMKLALPGKKTTLCCKFRPSDDLVSGFLKAVSYSLQEGPDQNRVMFKQTDNSPNKKRVPLILFGKK